jgi:hypothetical protein
MRISATKEEAEENCAMNNLKCCYYQFRESKGAAKFRKDTTSEI